MSMKLNQTTRKKLFALCRWLHVYLAMSFLALLVFFCVTGFTLNHAAWFELDTQSQISSLALPASLHREIQQSDIADVTKIKQFIEHHTMLSSPRSIDINMDIGEINFDYPLPAGYAFVTFFSDSGEIEIEHKQGSIVGLLNDLHKGRYTGKAWSLIIDISAVAIALFSITGLVILFQHKSRKNKGILMAILGVVFPVFTYLVWVPALSMAGS